MKFPMRMIATPLALALAGGALPASVLPELPAAALQALTQDQPARTASAKAYVNSLAASLGMGSADVLKVRHALTNRQGECVVRFDQYHEKNRVAGACIIVKVEPDGTITLGANSLKANLPIETTATALTVDEALEVLTAKLSPTVGYAAAPTVEPIVFSAELAGSLLLAENPATGLVAMDPLRSAEVHGALPPTTRAYQINCELLAGNGAPSARLTVIMDAETGLILDRSVAGGKDLNPFLFAKGSPVNPAQAVAAKQMLASARATMPVQSPVQRLSASGTVTAAPTFGQPTVNLVPTVGTGLTQYFGTVLIPTTYDPVLNGYGLLDTTRGSASNPVILRNMGSYDEFNNYHLNTLRPSGNLVVTNNGLSALVPYTMDGLSGSMSPVTSSYESDHQTLAADLVTGRPGTAGTAAKDNIWGNWGNYVPTTDYTRAQGAFGLEGQSAAADAMNSMTCAHEFMKWAFNRVGLDGNDTAMTAVVNSSVYAGNFTYFTRAAWEVDEDKNPIYAPFFRMIFGTGIESAGLMSMAEPTLIGQTIGNMLWEETLGYSGSSSIFDWRNNQQAFANLMSQGIYSLGSLHGINRRAVFPSYTFGKVFASGGYWFSMVQPSLDGISPDGYYDGSSMLGGSDATMAAGPMNRAYFFMAEGASAVSGNTAYSEFLPEGMTGMGLEKTCKIAYKAVTEELASPYFSGMEMRQALIRAAANLYGEGSPEVIATWNAWGAVNIGPAWGKADPVRVWIDMKNFDPNSDLGANGPAANARSDRYPWVPAGEPTNLNQAMHQVNAPATAEAGYTWSVNPAPYHVSGFYDLSRAQNGQISGEGIFKGPVRQPTGSIFVTSFQARSKADTRQWAQGMVINLTFDWDGDGANDALDIGMLGLAYGIDYTVLPAINDTIFLGFPGVSEGEVQMALAAFRTAFKD